jgi:hypothetical protein
MSTHSNPNNVETATPRTDDGSASVPETERNPVEPSDFERAYAEVESEILAVPTEHLVHITVDVRFVAVNTVARLPRIQSLRAEIAEHLPKFDLELLDRLGTYALAAAHAYFRNQTAAASPAEIAELSARVTERRSVLLADVKAFVAHGLIDGAPLAGLAGTIGYRNVAYDLLILRNMLVDAWSRIADKTFLTADSLEEDAAAASRLLMAAGAKAVLPLEPTETARVRDQAFALFVKKYDQVRRAVSFVRWEAGDADDYAPSLYAGRGSRKSDEAPAIDAPPTPTGPVVAPGENHTASGSAPAAAVATNPFIA